MVGTADEHWHEGTDIMAPAGTELYATERGILTQVGSNSLGGTVVWLKGESGTYYYYAHLSRYADGVHKGLVVEAGQLIGYVGTTGNAVGGPPHLHFEVHPDGGEAVNPYPLLAVVDEMREAAART
jgi:murein DD-endopeptidase MepM/ murein hydrolase activator NlpD